MPMMPGSGLPSMNYSSMGMMNTSTGSASPSESQQNTAAPPPAATSTPMSPGASNLSVDSQLAYQQAFLQNAVAQNMQIQQQLMMQNQALNQMLAQTSTVRNASSPEKSSMSPRPDTSPNRAQPSSSGPQKPVPVYFGMTEAHRRASESQLSAGPPQELYEASKHMSKTAPNTPRHSTNIPPQAPTLSALDAYGRAKTVRIGKWRWPPPKEESEGMGKWRWPPPKE